MQNFVMDCLERLKKVVTHEQKQVGKVVTHGQEKVEKIVKGSR